MARTYPKCATCGHPLPIKPDPALRNEAGRLPSDMGRSPQFYVWVITASLAAWVAFTVIMMGVRCD